MSTIDYERLYDSVAPAADVPDGPDWKAWRISMLSAAEFGALGSEGSLSETQLAYLAGFGLLAPTSHNTVPQRFELCPASSEIHVGLDRGSVLADSDPTGRQAVISVGCAVANVELAAQSLGWEVELEVDDALPDAAVQPPARASKKEESSAEAEHKKEPPVRLATLRLSRAEPSSVVEWRDLMRRRKMVRAEFDRSVALPPELEARLDAVVTSSPGLELHLISDAPTKLFLGKFQELADSTVINRAGFARELGEWLLDNDASSSVGMRGREFGLSDDASRRFHRGLKGELRLLPDETVGFAKAGNIGMRSASAIGVITVAKDDLVHRLAAGRAYQRVALTLLQHDFVVAMHAGITEVTAPNMALRGRLKTRRRPEVVFRMGRPLRPEDGERPHASRPLLGAILV